MGIATLMGELLLAARTGHASDGRSLSLRVQVRPGGLKFSVEIQG